MEHVIETIDYDRRSGVIFRWDDDYAIEAFLDPMGRRFGGILPR